MLVPRDAAARKPKHGAPCNRCGLCCMATLCPLGVRVFGGKVGPCPALALEVSTATQPAAYACGLTIDPAISLAMREAAALIVGAGQGCDARINGEPENLEFQAELRRQDARDAERLVEARRLWGMS